MKNLMTIVVPCYNEEEVLPLFMEAITPIRTALSLGEALDLSSSSLYRSSGFPPCDTELIFIDDGSQDRTLELLRQYSAEDAGIKYISFSRNFGKEAGIYAGLKESRGDYVVLLDADLQHPVEFILNMYEILTAGPEGKTVTLAQYPDDTADTSCLELPAGTCYDSVAMYRADRKGENKLRSFFSNCFYHMINRISKIDLIDGATDYRMMTRKMVDAVVGMEEYNRFTKGIFNWVGFNTCWLPYHNVERKAGTTKWSLRSLLRYSLEGMFAFSTTPLTISFGLGLIFCILALIFAVYVVIKTLIWGDPVAGYPSLFCMILFFGGVQLLFLGIFGQYLSKMYMEVKKRPKYIIRESSTDAPKTP
ncbi:MAG: glycosyltransferase family 2 protein [Lachnospiraceae bacterium]|nr:glycosyltransferase family 2 protein [Lachnospiraceae bacterium]